MRLPDGLMQYRTPFVASVTLVVVKPTDQGSQFSRKMAWKHSYAVIFHWHTHEYGINTVVFQRSIILFGLRDWRPIVCLASHD